MSYCGYDYGGSMVSCRRAISGADVVFVERAEEHCGHAFHLVARRGEVYEDIGVTKPIFQRLLAEDLELIPPYTLTHHTQFILRVRQRERAA